MMTQRPFSPLFSVVSEHVSAPRQLKVLSRRPYLMPVFSSAHFNASWRMGCSRRCVAMTAENMDSHRSYNANAFAFDL